MSLGNAFNVFEAPVSITILDFAAVKLVVYLIIFSVLLLVLSVFGFNYIKQT